MKKYYPRVQEKAYLCIIIMTRTLMMNTEKQDIRRAQDGDAKAQRRIYQAHAGYLYAVCSRYLSQDDDVKDAMQEAFIKIFTHLDSFQYRGEGTLRSWMTRIVVNESLRHLRSKTFYDESIEDVADIEEKAETDLGEFSAEDIHSMIRQLPDGYRTVLNLYVFEGKSHKEIGQMLGISETTSASQYHRAKRMMRKIITRHRNE